MRQLNRQSDEKLMWLFQEGLSPALDIIYKRYNKSALFYFYRMFNGDEQKAQDFLQDLFYKIIAKKKTYDTGQKFSTWFYSIAANMCKNEFRRVRIRKTAQTKLQCPDENVTELRVHSRIMADMIWKEIAYIPDSQKSVFLLRFQNGFSVKEIAETLGCSEGTVKSRLFYTIKRLSNKFSEIKAPHRRGEK